MVVKAYLSNICRAWPFERQIALLAERVRGFSDVPTYRDQLGPRYRQQHNPERLTQRGDMLRPTARRSTGGETIYVATLAVLAWTQEDLLAALAAAAARGATVIALDTGRRIEPGAGAAELAAVIPEFLSAKRAGSGEGRMVGVKASLAKRAADIAERIALIRSDWPKMEPPTAELLVRAGKRRNGSRRVFPMSYNTAAAHLGSRPQAQRNHLAAQKRAERRKPK